MMPKEPWKSVSLREGVLDDVDAYVQDESKRWSSRADFITYAIRFTLQKLRNGDIP